MNYTTGPALAILSSDTNDDEIILLVENYFAVTYLQIFIVIKGMN